MGSSINEEPQPTPTNLAMAVYDEVFTEFENLHIETRGSDEEDMILQAVKPAVKDMVTNLLSTMVQESLDDILQTLFHHAKSGIRSALYNSVELQIMEPLRKDLIGELVDAHVAVFLTPVQPLRGC